MKKCWLGLLFRVTSVWAISWLDEVESSLKKSSNLASNGGKNIESTVGAPRSHFYLLASDGRRNIFCFQIQLLRNCVVRGRRVGSRLEQISNARHLCWSSANFAGLITSMPWVTVMFEVLRHYAHQMKKNVTRFVAARNYVDSVCDEAFHRYKQSCKTMRYNWVHLGNLEVEVEEKGKSPGDVARHLHI